MEAAFGTASDFDSTLRESSENASAECLYTFRSALGRRQVPLGRNEGLDECVARPVRFWIFQSLM